MTAARFTCKCNVVFCNHFWVQDFTEAEIVRQGKYTHPRYPYPACPKCGNRGTGTPEFKQIKAVVTETECRGDCWAARGTVCRCSCGGENHGRAHLLVNLGSDSTKFQPDQVAA